MKHLSRWQARWIRQTLLSETLAATMLPVAISVACILLLSVAALVVQKLTLEAESRLRLETLARFVANAAELPALTDDSASLTKIVNNAMSMNDVLFVEIVPADGNTVRAARKGFDWNQGGKAGKDYIEQAMPIRSSASSQILDWDLGSSRDSFGQIRIGLSADRQQTLFRKLVWWMLIASLGISLAILYVQHRRTRHLLAPLKSVIEFTRQVAAGDLSQRATVRGQHEVRQLAVACNDMAEAIEMSHRRLKSALEAAEVSSRLKSEFVANISHEIRTPLNGVMGLTELVLGTDLTADQRICLDTALNSAQSLLGLLNNVLDFSKIEAEQIVLEKIEFDLHATVAQTVKAYGLAAQKKGLELLLEVSGETPEWVIGDPYRLRQVIDNLLSNAVKFTSAGEIVVSVRTTGRDESGMRLDFSVADTGIGISREQQGIIFEAFRQADGSTTRKYGGTGLGLSISSRLVSLMDGEIRLESGLGRGSRFIFTGVFGVAKQQPMRKVPEYLVGLRALVVGDNRKGRSIVREYLERWGIRAEEAEDGVLALHTVQSARASADPIRLVIVDGGPASSNGLDLCSQIRQIDNESSFVVLNAMGQAPRPAFLDQDFVCAVHPIKPATQQELLQAVTRALQVRLVTPLEGPPEAKPAESDTSMMHLSVLVAEDNPVNQMLIRRLLERHGCAVCICRNGAEAVHRMEEEAFDVVLMDVQMPVMDGLEATRVIRRGESQTGTHTPIIAMTAHAMTGDRERCLASGMDGYVSKPISAAELLAAIRATDETQNERPRLLRRVS